MKRDVKDLLNKLNIHEEDISVFEVALTHPSYNLNIHAKHEDYQRLEFIGDSVLGFVCADLIYKNHPEMGPGKMTKLRSKLVDTLALSSYARQIDLQDYIYVSDSIKEKQLAKSDHILEDVFEALVGAIYLTKDIGFTYDFLEFFLKNRVLHCEDIELEDPKTKLQEQMQMEGREPLTYTITKFEGPAHDRTFYCEVSLLGLTIGKGKGKTKQLAEKDAARDALAKRSL